MYNAYTTSSIIVNYVLGVGLLALPYIFWKAGILLASSALLLAGVVTATTAVAVAEAEDLTRSLLLTRTLVLPGWKHPLDTPKPSESSHLVPSGPSPTHDAPVGTLVVNNQDHVASDPTTPFNRNAPELLVEVVDMVLLYGGLWWRNVYLGAIVIYLAGGLWAYAAIFSVALASAFPLAPVVHHAPPHLSCDNSAASLYSPCENVYLVYVGLFALIVIPLSFVDIASQKIVQVILTVLRYLTLLVMVVFPVVSLYTNATDAAPGAPKHPPYLAPGWKSFFNWDHAGLALLTALYANVFQHSVPGILAPHRNKGTVAFVLVASIALITLLYIVLGVTSAIYFGDSIQSSININYRTLKYGSSIPTWLGTGVNYVVVLFPGAASISTFPLISLTLANSLLVTLPPDWRTPRTRLLTRAISSIPPIAGAALVRDLATILAYTALLAIIIGVVVPVFILLSARKAVSSASSPISSHLTSPLTSSLAIIFSVLFALAALASFIWGLVI